MCSLAFYRKSILKQRLHRDVNIVPKSRSNEQYIKPTLEINLVPLEPLVITLAPLELSGTKLPSGVLVVSTTTIQLPSEPMPIPVNTSRHYGTIPGVGNIQVAFSQKGWVVGKLRFCAGYRVSTSGVCTGLILELVSNFISKALCIVIFCEYEVSIFSRYKLCSVKHVCNTNGFHFPLIEISYIHIHLSPVGLAKTHILFSYQERD
ncbi:hypothetical protein G2W53_034762 [Senna tora]|uniref:Uncharacterized protein n=1 Tax=Senna tora TaxID=362788 RepID=A0A834WC71_9FABA|nr:hypothetical protein G2W53_034762 [Senna tora]